MFFVCFSASLDSILGARLFTRHCSLERTRKGVPRGRHGREKETEISGSIWRLVFFFDLFFFRFSFFPLNLDLFLSSFLRSTTHSDHRQDVCVFKSGAFGTVLVLDGTRRELKRREERKKRKREREIQTPFFSPSTPPPTQKPAFSKKKL